MAVTRLSRKIRFVQYSLKPPALILHRALRLLNSSWILDELTFLVLGWKKTSGLCGE